MDFINENGILITSNEEKWGLYLSSRKKRRVLYKPILESSYHFEGSNMTQINPKRAGVYILLNAYSSIMSVGESTNLQVRVRQRMTGRIGGSLGDEFFKDFFIASRGTT